MGLITGLLTLPLAPVRGTIWLAEQITAEAERELYDEDRIMRELMDLELRQDVGEIDEAEREALEEDLLDRLAISRERAAAGDPRR